MKLRFSVLVLALVAIPSRSFVQNDVRSLYRMRAPVTLPSDGRIRLPLTADVVAEAGAELTNLRLSDRDGNEIPFAIDPSPAEAARIVHVGPIVPLEASREQLPGEPATFVERFELALPDTAPPGSPWELDLGIDAPVFTATLTISVVGAHGATELARRTVFRLQPGIDRTRFPVEVAPASRLAIELRGQSGFLAPRLGFVSTIAPTSPVVLRFPARIERTTREGSATLVDVSLPNGLRPSRIEIESRTPAFAREVSVTTRIGGETVEIGSARIERATGEPPIDRRVASLGSIENANLRIRIEDGASPPLADLVVIGLVDQPSLVFDSNGAFAQGRSLDLFYGGDRIVRGPYAEDAMLLSRGSRDLPLATLGARSSNAAYSPAPALAFAMRAGAVVDPRAFRFRAPLVVPNSPDGLTRVEIPVEILAVASEHLEDVRVVDARNRQWPFLVAPDDRLDRAVPVAARRVRSEPRKSAFEIDLPGDGLVIEGLAIDPNTPLVNRPVGLEEISDPDHSFPLLETSLVRAPGSRDPIELHVQHLRYRKLRLTIEDGDEAPLAPSFRVLVARASLLLAAPAGRYTLYVGAQPGSDEAHRPRYDLESSPELVAAVRSASARPGALTANPESAPPRAFSKERWHDIALWSVLVVATLALFGLTLRLVRSEAET